MSHATELRTLANAHEDKGDYATALDLHRRAFLMQERAVGKNSPDIAPFIYDLAMIHAALDHDGEARKLLAWLLRLLPAQDPLVKEVDLVLSELQQAETAA